MAVAPQQEGSKLFEWGLRKALREDVSDHLSRGGESDHDCAALDLLARVMIGEVNVFAGAALHGVVIHGDGTLAVTEQRDGLHCLAEAHVTKELLDPLGLACGFGARAVSEWFVDVVT